jgi:hypothetical protein
MLQHPGEQAHQLSPILDRLLAGAGRAGAQWDNADADRCCCRAGRPLVQAARFSPVVTSG